MLSLLFTGCGLQVRNKARHSYLRQPSSVLYTSIDPSIKIAVLVLLLAPICDGVCGQSLLSKDSRDWPQIGASVVVSFLPFATMDTLPELHDHDDDDDNNECSKQSSR